MKLSFPARFPRRPRGNSQPKPQNSRSIQLKVVPPKSAPVPGLLDAALMMSEATLPGEQCWRRLREVSDDQPLPYFSTILVNKQWEEA